MDPQGNRNWAPSGPPEASRDPHSPLQQRQHGSYGPTPPVQAPPMQMTGPPPLPPPQQGGSFFNQSSGGNALPSLSGLAQSSPPQSTHAAPPHQGSSPLSIHHQGQVGRPQSQQNPGYALPGINQAMQQSPAAERERQLYEEDRQRQQELREQQRLAESQRSPSEVHGGTVPLRQPVASRISTGLHGPNGILSANPDVTNNASLGAPSGPPNSFPNSGAAHVPPMRTSYLPQPNGHLIHGQAPLTNAPASNAPQNGSSSNIPQNSQPILNDALTYLDQVKVRFQSQPDVYNRFLDIMKDFKSQAIDTPGVINRVSALFSGHPQLIQGFNTFLPPGYKIEAGWGNDPNNIRVYTPLGAHESNLGSANLRIVQPADSHLEETITSPRQRHAEGYQARDETWSQLPTEAGTEGPFSPNARQAPPSVHAQRAIYDAQYGGRHGTMDAEAQAAAHAQEQQGVSQLQSAANVAVGQPGRLGVMQHSSGAGSAPTALNEVPPGGTPGQSFAIEKRGPVEFNHAISYVNKIKTRFHHQPEIYKQFLEILHTYQKESKPIQDVYAQVTQLFSAAPDLLEDFKQFLPESAAQAQAAAARRATEEAAMLSNVRGDASHRPSAADAQTHTPKPDKMPPMGNFAPPSSMGKENSKKRRVGASASFQPGVATSSGQDLGRTSAQPNNGTKRPKTTGQKPLVVENIPIPSPSLVPELPRPLPPSISATTTTQENIGFFDRVRKHVANKQAFNEFLKLCNLFAEEVLDKNTLVQKVEALIGPGHDLMAQFKKFVNYSPKDELIDNTVAQHNGSRVALSFCRALGPSYRLLPKRERVAKCSGRDEMCQSVLNDNWASHPTWASEDSGFVAHRKNIHEEALHRMEEERHDYDFNIETGLRTIQLLEPIVQQLQQMSAEEQVAFRLPNGLGGQNEAIWQRVVKKIYGRESGGKVIADLLFKPSRVAPFLLIRIKERVEAWKAAQREWEKIWREQTQKQFWRSLDHQGISVKNENKRAFQPKALQTEIQAKYEEQRRQKQGKLAGVASPSYQLSSKFTDVDVIHDCCHILLTYLRDTYVGNDQVKVENFIKTFIPTFFAIDRDALITKMADIYTDPPSNEEEEDSPASDEATQTRGRRIVNGKKNLLRDVLDPSKPSKMNIDSKESTPDPMSVDGGGDDENAALSDSPSEQPRTDPSQNRWIELALNGTSRGISYNDSFPRDTYSLYANLNIYCFFRMFDMLYQRLCNVKISEDRVREDVRRAMAPKAAIDLKMNEKNPTEYFDNTSSAANYYQQILKMCEGVLQRSIDISRLEDTLRRFYLAHGHQLYGFDKLVTAVVKFASQSIVNDAKDRSNDIINLFFANRKESETTHQKEIDYRKQVEKLAKDSEIYRIIWHQETKRATIAVFKKDDLTFDLTGMPSEFSYKYYVTSYMLRDPTEGVPRNIHLPYIKRANPIGSADDPVPEWPVFPIYSEEQLEMKVSPVNYRLMWEPDTSEWFLNGFEVLLRGITGMGKIQKNRKADFISKFEEKPTWAQNMSSEEVDKIKNDYEVWVTGQKAVEQEKDQEKKGEETEPAELAEEPKEATDSVEEADKTDDKEAEKQAEDAKETKDEEMADAGA